MLEACVISELDKHGRAHPDAGKIICVRAAGFAWSPAEEGESASNLCIVVIPDPPLVLMQRVAAKRSGLVVYPFARRDADGKITDFSMVRVKAIDSRPRRRVEFGELEGAGQWVSLSTP